METVWYDPLRATGQEDMLEEIHATTEDERKTRIIVALTMVAFGMYALLGAALGGWSVFATIGLLIGSGGAAMLQRAVSHPTPAPLHLAR
jgi:hypothetical protein